MAVRLQILTAEHASLMASRSLAWNESFARGGMYLSTLSGAMVALGLIAGLDRVGDLFFLFAMVILPVVLFIGLATFIRMGAANYHEGLTVAGMNRIRGAYLEIAPELEPYFVMGVHDDLPGLARTMAVPPHLPPIVHLLAATSFVVSVLNAVIAGALAAVVLARFVTTSVVPTAGLAILVFVLVLVAQTRSARSNVRRTQRENRPMSGPRSEG
ncbi:MAG: hypothetical protein ACHQ15_07255 [Candidatus Limnocylindrales bacterium]